MPDVEKRPNNPKTKKDLQLSKLKDGKKRVNVPIGANLAGIVGGADWERLDWGEEWRPPGGFKFFD